MPTAECLFPDIAGTERSPRTHRAPVVTVKLVREGSVPYEGASLRSPEAAHHLLRAFLADEPREHFVVVGLNTKSAVVGINTVSVGNLDSAIVSPREVFQAAILMNAATILVCHNHPSGDPEPSSEDRVTNKRLVDAGKILGIDVVDHIILGEFGRFVSLRERGWM